ncbi:hypothetical protein LSAT2_007706 [Lamellibrachia satsuma]|nr:hypothetical protein LSAT2_007706 [Lamellibrachia satsuma]
MLCPSFCPSPEFVVCCVLPSVLLLSLGDAVSFLLSFSLVSDVQYIRASSEARNKAYSDVHFGIGGKNDVKQHMESDCHKTKASVLSRMGGSIALYVAAGTEVYRTPDVRPRRPVTESARLTLLKETMKYALLNCCTSAYKYRHLTAQSKQSNSASSDSTSSSQRT